MESRLEELLSEILVIKDLYVCGRLNQSICLSAVSVRGKDSNSNWEKYEALSDSYVNDSISELLNRRETLIEEFDGSRPVSANVLYDTSYMDFDEDLINDMMQDFFGSKDSIAFASSYNYFAEDFNAILSEFIVNDLV
jgi:hypothetical protein